VIRSVFDSALVSDEFVVDKYGVTPDQLLDYFALVGDAADNIPGTSSVLTSLLLSAEIMNQNDVLLSVAGV
jgi:DNA polymerase-1